MKSKITIIDILSCELVGLYHQLTLLRKLRHFTFEHSLHYYVIHEELPEALRLSYAKLISSSYDFCKNMAYNPLSYLKSFSVDELHAFIWLIDNVISSLEYYYELD